MCDVSRSLSTARFFSYLAFKVCKYPEKTKSRITKLSTVDDARANVPQRQVNNVPQGSTKDRERVADARQFEDEPFVSAKGSYGQQTYGAQKRSGSDYPESYPKKSKIALAPALGGYCSCSVPNFSEVDTLLLQSDEAPQVRSWVDETI